MTLLSIFPNHETVEIISVCDDSYGVLYLHEWCANYWLTQGKRRAQNLVQNIRIGTEKGGDERSPSAVRDEHPTQRGGLYKEAGTLSHGHYCSCCLFKKWLSAVQRHGYYCAVIECYHDQGQGAGDSLILFQLLKGNDKFLKLYYHNEL